MEEFRLQPERLRRLAARLFTVLAAFALCAGTGLGAQPPDDPASYLKGLLERLPPSEEWERWLKQTGELPRLEPLAPRAAHLPDPLRFASGQPVRTRQDWQRRRAEIRSLYERFITGSWPPPPQHVTAREVNRRREDRAEVRELRLELDGRPEPSIGLRLFIPDGAGPFPVFLGPAWTESWARLALRRGYLCAIYAGSDNWDDAAALGTRYPDYGFALIARRAWAGARVLDYLESLPAADMARVVLTGHSRDGKQALLLAAFDERIRAVIPSSSGTFGANPFRFTGEMYFSESLERKTRWDPAWFHPRSRFFAGQEHRLPVDQNLLIALVAPRACLLSQALHDDNDPPWGVEQAYLSARQVYHWLDAEGRLGIRWRDQLHGTHARDIEDYLDWFDMQIGRKAGTWHTELLWGFDWDKWRENRAPAGLPGSAGSRRRGWGAAGSPIASSPRAGPPGWPPLAAANGRIRGAAAAPLASCAPGPSPAPARASTRSPDTRRTAPGS